MSTTDGPQQKGACFFCRQKAIRDILTTAAPVERKTPTGSTVTAPDPKAVSAAAAKLTALALSFEDLTDLLSGSEFSDYCDLMARSLVEAQRLVNCPACQAPIEVDDAAAAAGAAGADDAKATAAERAADLALFKAALANAGSGSGGGARVDATGEQTAFEHFLRRRVRCPRANCKTVFCSECQATPYHTGFTCAEFKLPKCLFCCAPVRESDAIEQKERKSEVAVRTERAEHAHEHEHEHHLCSLLTVLSPLLLVCCWCCWRAAAVVCRLIWLSCPVQRRVTRMVRTALSVCAAFRVKAIGRRAAHRISGSNSTALATPKTGPVCCTPSPE
jgi:hypothetical protein